MPARALKVLEVETMKKHLTLIRYGILLILSTFMLMVGYKFYAFVDQFRFLSPGMEPPISRPAAVEGLLPISGFMGLIQWLRTGLFDQIHPAGLSIMLVIIILSFLLKRGFCSWLCPVGFAFEALSNLGKRIFGRNFTLPKWLDIPLRGVKYLLLYYLAGAIIKMPIMALASWVNSPYNKISDVKMLQFFLHIETSHLVIIGILAASSLLVHRFWCRYLCPYGALLGLVSLVSPLSVVRDEESCTNCSLCTKACPNQIRVEAKKRVVSPECTSCLACIEACPQKDALKYGVTAKFGSIPVVGYPLLFVGLFLVGVGIAKATGNWETALTTTDYLQLIPLSGQIH